MPSSAVDEAAAAALGEQDDEIGERLPEAERDDVGARLEHRQVLLGGVAGREVDEAVGGGELRDARRRRGSGSASRWPSDEHDDVGDERLVDPVQDHTAWRPSAPSRTSTARRSVHDDVDVVGGSDASTWRWNQSRYTDCTSRVGNVIGVEAADLGGQRRGRAARRACRRRPCAAHSCSDGPGRIGPSQLHRVVGEHRDVLGHRVHPQQRVEVGRATPDRCPARRRVDEVDPQRSLGEQLGRVGRQTLEQRRRRRAGADDRQLHGFDDEARGQDTGRRERVAASWRAGGRAQAEVIAQRRPVVVGAEHATLLQQRHDLVDEVVEAVGREVRNEDVAVGGVGLHVLGRSSRRPSPRVPTNAERAVTSMTSWRMLRPFALGERPPLRGDGERVVLVAHPAAGDRDAAVDVGVDVGQRPVGVVGRQVAAPHLLEEGDRALRADLLQADVARRSSWASASVSPTTAVAAGMILRSSWRAAVAGQASLDVGVERLPVGVARSGG